MSEQNKANQSETENYSDRSDRPYKTGYVVVIMDYARNIKDTPFATFDRALAEEIALAYGFAGIREFIFILLAYMELSVVFIRISSLILKSR